MTDSENSDLWTVERFEHWVRVGAESYVLEGASPVAFPEAAHLILRTGSVELGLRAFAERLNAQRRSNLKQAVAQALSSLEPRERFRPVAELLLSFAVAIYAYPILSVLASKIGNGFFGQEDAESRDSLFAMTLYSVARLATPGRDDAKRCLRELIASTNFKPAHASTALIALCQVDPRGLAEHFSTPNLRPSLAEQFKLYDPDGEVKMQVARQIFAIVGPENYRDALCNLEALLPNVAGPSPDDWLAEGVLFTPGSPVEIAEINDDLVWKIRSNPNVIIQIPHCGPKLTSRTIPDVQYHHAVLPNGNLATASRRELIDESVRRMNSLFASRSLAIPRVGTR